VDETWKPVVGYEGSYEVSSLGRVRSLDRIRLSRRKKEIPVKGRMLRACKNNQGYPTVNLCKDGIGKTFKVHTLVMSAFVGPRPEGTEILHGKLGKEVNTLDNLRYDTHIENEKDKIRDGTSQHVLSDEKILEIRYLYDSEQLGITRISRLFDLDRDQVWKIVHRISYKHVEEVYEQAILDPIYLEDTQTCLAYPDDTPK